MRTKMQPKIGLFLFTLLFPWAIPLTAEALKVEFCRPDCATATAANKTTVSEAGTPVQNPTNVFTTTLSLTGVTVGGASGFAIQGTNPRAIAQQSGTLQKLTVSTMTVRAPTAGCSVAAPCLLQMILTSDPNDYPTLKPASVGGTGGYLAGAYLSGFFSPQPAPPPPPAGKTYWNYPPTASETTKVLSPLAQVSMTAEASGLGTGPGFALQNTDVLNQIGGGLGTGGGPAASDTPRSLPSKCQGSTGCVFAATTAIKSFNTLIEKTVQQKCEGAATSCQTRLRAIVNMRFVAPSNSVTFPLGFASVDPPPADGPPLPLEQNPLALLTKETLPPLENLNVKALRVFSNLKIFELDGGFTLDDGNSIDPPNEEVYLKIGGFTMTIPVGMFRRFVVKGRVVFTFLGKVDSLNVLASLLQGADPTKWTFVIAVNGINLTPLLPAAGEVPVDIAVGGDTGFDRVLACFSKGCFSPHP